MLTGADLSLMPGLEALLDEANVTRAAARLNLSQPAMSAQLARLRLLFDDPLLAPASKGRGMVLTPRAMALRDGLRAALAGLEALVEPEPAFDPAVSERLFRIVANDNAARTAGVALAAQVKAAGAPHVRVALLTPNARPLVERLESGEADLAIGSTVSLPGGEGLMQKLLYEDGFRTAQRKGHPRGQGPFDLDAYCALEHVIVSAEGGGFSGSVDRVLAELGRRRRVSVSVQAYLLAPAVIAATDLVGTLPGRFLEAQGDQLEIFDTPLDLPPFRMAALWHARMQEDPAHVWLRGQLAAAVAGSAAE
jgi:DNA-binding transcriptional LysR family regulator